MAPLRVLHVGKYYPPVSGGMETVLKLLCQHERTSVDGRVLVANLAGTTVEETVDGVAVTRVGSIGTVGAVTVCPALPLRLRRMAADADLVVVHEPNPMALLAYFIARPATPTIVWFHSEVIRPAWRYRLFYRPFLHFCCSRARRIVVSSPSLAERAAQLESFKSRCTVIPYGIDPDRLRPDAAIDRRVAELRRETPGPVVLFVGRLVGYKGVDVLLRAFQGLEVHAVIVGNGPLRPALEALASELGVQDRVRFAGEVDDRELVALYHACDLFVLPSVTRQEAFGMVQLEAMACAKPVVSTDLPSGVPWVNQHQRTGLIVPPSDVTALRGAIATLARDPERRARLGAGGRERVLCDFTMARMARQTTELYRTVVCEQGAVLAEAGAL